MTKFDRASLLAIRNDINAALVAVATKHGIALSSGSCSFTSINATIKIIASVKNLDGTVESPERSAFKSLHSRYGFELTDLDREFQFRDRSYKIIGLNRKGRTEPILCQAMDGRIFKFSCDIVKLALPQKA